MGHSVRYAKRRRNAKEIRADGTVRCTLCNEWKFITEFYERPGIYVIVDDVEHGKPQSHCVSCCLVRAKEIRAAKEQAAKELRAATFVSDEAIASMISPATKA